MLPELRADYWTERRKLDRISQMSFTAWQRHDDQLKQQEETVEK